jgi:PKD repeat protein
MNVSAIRGFAAIPLLIVLLIGWMASAVAADEVQTDSTTVSGTASGEVTIEAFAEAPAPTLLASADVVATYIPVAFDASDFEVQSPSSAVYAWDLTGEGDVDATSGTPLLFHTYQQPGTYSVSVHITDASGTDVLSAPIDIVVMNRSPEALFSVSSESISDRASVQFQDLSRDVDGRVVSWSWDFGDGTTSTDPDPSHAYANPGVYAVRLTVTDDTGASSKPFSLSLSVVNTSPVATFSAPLTTAVSQLVAFDDESEDPSPEGRIVYVAWDFGDGSYITGTPRSSGTYTHAYAAAGVYTVKLYVIDEHGGLDIARGTIRVG